VSLLGALRARILFRDVSTVHLVRHGEVENPKGVIYGRLPGYHLSERGRKQAEMAAEHLADADIGIVRVSPLERAQETAAIIAERHGLEIDTDERVLESLSTLEGRGRSLWKLLRSPQHWWHFRNPMTPSWGESFTDIRKRMLEAIEDAVEAAAGREVVIVSHQTPVLVARMALTKSRMPPWLAVTQCRTGSVTTIVRDEGGFVSADYFEPRV
jgi:broad specificity phosphatase PhoE